MTPEKIYVITVVGSVCALANLIGCLTLVLAVVFLIGGMAIEKQRTLCFFLSRQFAAVAAGALILACIIPSKKDLAAMYVLPYLEKNAAKVAQMPDELVLAARAWIKQEVKR